MLSIRYRSHETICAVYNKLVYSDVLQSDPALNNSAAILGVPWDSDNRVHWLHVRGDECNAKGSSVSNDTEANVVVQFLEGVYCNDRGIGNSATIGVLCAYTAQVKLVRCKWQHGFSCRRSNRNISFDISAIDKFQGGKQDAVIISLASSNDLGKLGFCSGPCRLNVALSRAKCLCIMVGDCKHCYDSDHTGLLWGLAG